MTISRPDIRDLIDDLHHDLGKYIVLPLVYLPDDAAESAVRNAIRKGVLETRRNGDSVQSAQNLYDNFVARVGHRLAHLPGWTELEDAMKSAKGWIDAAHRADNPISREAVTKDLQRVGHAIRRLETQFTHE